MKKLSLVLSFFSCISLYAQNAVLKGTLKDSKSNETLIGVNIAVENNTAGTTSDVDGRYELSLAPGKYNIIFSYVGYDNITKSVTLKAGQTDNLDVLMGELQSMLDEVVVTSSKFERKIGEESVSIDIIKPAALEKQNLNDVKDVLMRSSGVTVVDGQANIRGGSGYSYGAGTA
ncbi:MAG: carboxypeptidase-like regulatory domain-containing protein [Sphingobacteriales bacterium]|nr:carboxypeptidase-like regulatory domain-containing protein [Sphingobacteriales bacterium]